MHPVRQDEGQGVAREGPLDAADQLHGVAAQIDLNLEILVAMGARLGAALELVADVKVRPLAALP
jgi:hypothetical protein